MLRLYPVGYGKQQKMGFRKLLCDTNFTAWLSSQWVFPCTQSEFDSTYTCYIWSSYHIPLRRVLALSSPWLLCRYQGAVVRSPQCPSLSGLNELGSLSLSYWCKWICTCPHFSRLAPIYWFLSCASGPKAGHSIVKHGPSIIILKSTSVHWVLEGLKYSWWTQISETGQSSGDTVADQWDM